jgi:hypothetical protein
MPSSATSPKTELDDVEQLPLVHAVSVPLSVALRVYNVDPCITLSIVEEKIASVNTVDAVPNVGIVAVASDFVSVIV